jgi:hypothetical protein
MFLLMCVAVSMVWIWPQIILWLPAHMKLGG